MQGPPGDQLTWTDYVTLSTLSLDMPGLFHQIQRRYTHSIASVFWLDFIQSVCFSRHSCQHLPDVVGLKSKILSAEPEGLVQIGAKGWHPIATVYHDPHPAHRGAVIMGLFCCLICNGARIAMTQHFTLALLRDYVSSTQMRCPLRLLSFHRDYVVVWSLLTLHVFNGRGAGSFEWVKGIAAPAGCRYGQPAA